MLSPASKHNGNAYVMFCNLKSNICHFLSESCNRLWQNSCLQKLEFQIGAEGDGIALGYGVVKQILVVKWKRNKASASEVHPGLLL